MDLASIRDTYARMDDNELQTFAETDGLKLNADAFLILREELQKRGATEILGKLIMRLF